MAKPARRVKTPGHFVPSDESAKSQLVAQLVRLARKERLDYATFLYICQQVRRKLGLRKPPRERRLPHLLPEADLKKFFRVLERCGNLQHEIMLKLLFYTAVRVSELVRIRVSDLDFVQCKSSSPRGKVTRIATSYSPHGFVWCCEVISEPIPRIAISSRRRATPRLTTARPADRQTLSGGGWDYTARASPPLPPSDADLSNGPRVI